MKKLKSDYKSFKNFLSAYNTEFSIPYYQRAYIWSNNGNSFVLKKFIRDIAEQFDDCNKNNYDKAYFIGNFATCKSRVNYIVDGQQRLTTLLIFLKILSNYTKTSIKSYFYNGDNFLISDSGDLSSNLEYFLFKKNTGTYDVNGSIKAAVDIIEKEVKDFVKIYSTEELVGLETYVLDNVYLSYVEFDSEKDALKYFLNINSLSVPLTEMEIFYAYMSQIIQTTSYSDISIDSIKENLSRIAKRTEKLSDEDLVYVFLKAYFKDDANIGAISAKKDKIGIGNWLSGYKMDILGNSTKALDLIKNFEYYLYDVEEILNYITGNKPGMSKWKQIHLNYILNSYTKNKNIKDTLLALLVNRHDYHTTNIYKDGTTDLDITKLDSFCKAANAVYITNFFNGNNKEDMLDIMKYTEPRRQSTATIKNIGYDNLLMLNYPTERQDIKYKIKDNQHEIHLVLAIQEAYLNYISNPVYSMNSLLTELLNTNNYTIEHLYTKKDFTDPTRLQAWEKIGSFNGDTAAKFDSIRSAFENLSLLNRNTNSSLNADTISKKIFGYSTVRSITSNNEPEFLVQSFSDTSEFYTDKNIVALKLPARNIILGDDGITWKHSKDNTTFIKELAEKAVNMLFI